MARGMTVFVIGVFLGILAASPASARERQGLVVWRLEAKTGVTEKDIDSISGYITSEAERHSGLPVISENEIRTLLEGEETRQRCGAEGAGCVAEIGSALGVPTAVSGDLGRLGGYWMLNLRRIDVRNAAVIERISAKVKGDMEALIDEIPYAVAELFGKTLPRPVKAPPKVQEPPKEMGMSPLRKGAIAGLAAGGALVILGGIGTWQAIQAADDADAALANRRDASADLDRRDAWRGVSVAGYVLGGIGIVTGVALFIVDGKRSGASSEKKSAQNDTVSFGFAPRPDGGFTVVFGGRFP